MLAAEDKAEKVQRKAVAALGELLFFISHQGPAPEAFAPVRVFACCCCHMRASTTACLTWAASALADDRGVGCVGESRVPGGSCRSRRVDINHTEQSVHAASLLCLMLFRSSSLVTMTHHLVLVSAVCPGGASRQRAAGGGGAAREVARSAVCYQPHLPRAEARRRRDCAGAAGSKHSCRNGWCLPKFNVLLLASPNPA